MIKILTPKEAILTRTRSFSACILCAAALSLFSLSCDDNNPAGTPSPTELEGKWSGVIVDEPGVSVGLEIHGNGMTYSYEGEEMYSGTFTLDKSVTPHRMDGVVTASQNSQYIGKTSLAIYQLSNDTLLLAGNEPGDPERPASFVPSGGTLVMRLVRQ
jgi:uncharacterized protein (TIGR03067 family)